MRRLAVVSLAVVAWGCAPQSEARGPAIDRVGYLVLIPDGDDVRTEWVGPDGALRGRADGAFLGIADRAYRFESRSERATVAGCGEPDEEAGVGHEGPANNVASALLVGLGDASSLELVGPRDAQQIEAFGRHHESHRVLAALGDRIVVLTRRVHGACGGPDEVEINVRAFDLGSGRELSPSETEREAGARRAPLALASLHATDPACALVGTRLTYAMTLPAFGPLGLGAQHRFEVAPGSCGSAHPTAVLEGPVSELPASYEERDVPSPVLAHAGSAGAIGVTWLDDQRAPMSDAFALASE